MPKVPETVRAWPGLFKPTPTRLFSASIEKVFESKFKAFVTLAKVAVEAAPIDWFKAPTEVSANIPEDVVEIVKLPAVLAQADTPPEASVTVPVELPSAIVEPAVDAKFVMPVELSEVNAAVLGVPEPIVPGASQVFDSKLLALSELMAYGAAVNWTSGDI